MRPMSATAVLAGATLSLVIGASAQAACSSRPDTGWIMWLAPQKSSPETTLALTLRSRGGETKYWDVEVRRDSPTGPIEAGRGLAGARGPTILFPKLEPGKTYCFRARARTEAGREGCTAVAFTEWGCKATVGPKQHSESARCREYALQAREARTEALGRYKCDPKVISGRGWDASYTEHYSWCLGATSQAAEAETAKRTQIMHQCRVDAAKPKGGNAQIRAYKAGNRFVISGSGFAPNVPVIIRLSGPGAATESITVTYYGKQRVVSDAAGRFTVVMPYPFVCKPSFARLAVRAEDQDNRKSPVVMTYCSA
jgi:hypothetical protein